MDKYLLTPVRVYSKSGIYFALFKKEDSLQQILCQTGLSFQQILLLGMDLCAAADHLIKGKYYDADISPANIYRRADGSFCLGDLSLEKGRTKGTPPYVDPKRTNFFSNKQSDFDLSMQYAICKLLDDLTSLQEEFCNDEMNQIIRTGTASDPNLRYPSVTALKEELSTLLEKISENSYPLLQIDSTMEHPLFQVKTLPLSHRSNPFIEFMACLLLIITGGIFLSALYRSGQNQTVRQDMIIGSETIESKAGHFQSDPQTAGQDHMPVSAISASAISASAIKPQVTPYLSDAPSATAPSQDRPDHSSASNEPDNHGELSAYHPPADRELSLDIQNKGYYSFNTVTDKTSDSEKYTCLYAGGNHFTALESVSKFKNLQELYLDDNQITDIAELSDCEELEILVLSYNHITDVSPLVRLKKLVHLDLSLNQSFADISSLEQMHQLEVLNLSGTQLSRKQVKELSAKLPDCQIIS